jgi:hypothetical protein
MSSYWTYGRLDTALAGGERSTYFYGSELNGVIWQVFAFALRGGFDLGMGKGLPRNRDNCPGVSDRTPGRKRAAGSRR